jgi:peptide/nickel transport system substrate-binding protein
MPESSLTNCISGTILKKLYSIQKEWRSLGMGRLPVWLLMILFISFLLIAGCKAPESRSLSNSSNSGVVEPRYGGTLRMIMKAGPRGLSPPAAIGPEDMLAVVPSVEKLMDISNDRSEGNGLEPVLAEKVEEDIAHNRIVFHLRKGVRFHDGSELNADVVIWNYQIRGAVQYSKYWKGITKLDDMTVQIEYTEYNSQLIQSWGPMPIFSKAAWEEASGGDPEKGKEWARDHCVGTGPFILKEYQRDSHITWVKNPDYWREGRPYLDGIECKIIPDKQTAKMVMLAGEADFLSTQYDKELEERGFTVLSGWLGLSVNIWPNTADPDSRWNDIRLRQALEYAIDKPAIARAFNQQRFSDAYVPMTMMAPPGEWGYDPNYPARSNDPEKARQLLAEAGYADGLDVQMLIMSDQGSRDFGTMLKRYLDEVGIRVELDLADPGRFFSTVYGTKPGPDLSVMYSGMDTNYLVTYMRWFSTDPMTNLSYLGHTPEQEALDEEAEKASSVDDQKTVTGKVVKYLTDNALIIPIIWYPLSSMAAPGVHIPYMTRKGGRWLPEETWMEKH